MQHWEKQHEAAMEEPSGTEDPLVYLLEACSLLVGHYGNDGELDKPVGKIVCALREITSLADLGRLDGATIERWAIGWLEQMGLDPDSCPEPDYAAAAQVADRFIRDA